MYQKAPQNLHLTQLFLDKADKGTATIENGTKYYGVNGTLLLNSSKAPF